MGLIINIFLLKSQITVAAVSATPWPTETWLLAPLAYPFLNYGYEKKKKNYNILAFEVYLIQERLTSDHPASKNAFIAKGKGYKIPLSELSPFRLLWVISSKDDLVSLISFYSTAFTWNNPVCLPCMENVKYWHRKRCHANAQNINHCNIVASCRCRTHAPTQHFNGNTLQHCLENSVLNTFGQPVL